jgi:hypothetical protein
MLKGFLIKIKNKQANSYFYSFANRKITNYATLVRKIVEVFSGNCKTKQVWIYPIVAASDYESAVILVGVVLAVLSNRGGWRVESSAAFCQSLCETDRSSQGGKKAICFTFSIAANFRENSS